MAAKRIMAKDLSRAIGISDPSWMSRRLSGTVPIDAATLLVVADFMDEDVAAVLGRAKDRATNPCLSHSPREGGKHTQIHSPPTAVPAAIRIA